MHPNNIQQIHYVLMLIFDPELKCVVTLRKERGPAHLIGKVTFPGGKVDPGESSSDAASREAREETGLFIEPQRWNLLTVKEGPDYKVDVYMAVVANAANARTMEQEKVTVLGVSQALQSAEQRPSEFADDFCALLSRAVRHKQPTTLHIHVTNTSGVCTYDTVIRLLPGDVDYDGCLSDESVTQVYQSISARHPDLLYMEAVYFNADGMPLRREVVEKFREDGFAYRKVIRGPNFQAYRGQPQELQVPVRLLLGNGQVVAQKIAA